MKQITAIIILIFLYITANSQSLTLSDQTGPVPNNTDIYLTGGFETLDCYITVNNVTNTNKTVECKKAYIEKVPGTMDFFCWGACYPPNTLVGSVPVVINANQSNNANFSGHYDCQNTPGTEIIRYTFFIVNNPLDTVCFNVHYSGCPVGIGELASLNGLSEPYPNPVNGYFSLRYSFNNTGNAILEIHNTQGSLVKIVPLTGNQGAVSIAASDLGKGLYFISLKDQGSVISRKKVVVN